MKPLATRLRGALFPAFLSATLASSASAATKMRLDRAVLDFDPNQPIWHVSSQICNRDQTPSGTLNYHIWLYMDDQSARSGRSHFHDLGGVKYPGQIAPGQCGDHADTRITVRYKDIPPGQYHIELVIGEWNGSKFVTVASQPFYSENGLFQDFIKN